MPSPVHSVNLTWATSTGSTQTQRFITAGVMPWPHRPGLFSGKFTKGQLARLVFCMPSYSCAKTFSEKPVPTLPGLRYSATVSANSPLELNGIEFWVDLPRPVFERGTAIAEGSAPVALARVRAAGPVLFRGQTPALRFQDATGKLAFDIGFDQPTATTIVDRWDNAGRSFQVVQKQGNQPFQRGGSGNDQHLSKIVRCGVCDESLDRIYESFFSPYFSLVSPETPKL